jgi:two-component system cell cycle sensor histidine kinase/response regulator CckA
MVRRIPGPTGPRPAAADAPRHHPAPEGRGAEPGAQGPAGARQRLEAVGRLAGGVAHDFNNLLTAIGGGASFLADHHDSEVREIASELRAAQERRGVADAAAPVVRAQGGHEPEGDRPRPFLERERQLLQRIVGERVVLDLDPSGAVPILLDEGQLEQVLLNLAVNARDAMSGHGTLYVGCKADGVHSVLTVRDTGCGMSDEVKRKVFEPFFTTKGVHGTGLGLSTVHGIVSSGGGTVGVRQHPGGGHRVPDPDAPGAGARPGGPVPRGRADAAPAGPHPARRRRRPHPRLRPPRAAADGAHGGGGPQRGRRPRSLRARGTVRPRLVGRDDAVMTGPELLARLRDQGATVPVLLMSGYVDDVLREGTFDVTTQLLLKPFSMDELSRRVDEAVRRPERAEDTRPG